MDSSSHALWRYGMERVWGRNRLLRDFYDAHPHSSHQKHIMIMGMHWYYNERVSGGVNDVQAIIRRRLLKHGCGFLLRCP